MWDENKVLELLKGMPHVLTYENLCDIQKLIDDNKFWNSRELKMDLCGVYAPFCKNCDKTVLTPCAVAYVRMKIAEGMQIEMENVSSQPEQTVAEKPVEKPVVEEVVVEQVAEQPVIKSAESKKIRIGVGYRNF